MSNLELLQHDNAPALASEEKHPADHASTPKLRWWDYLAYGSGQCGEGIMARSLDTFLVFYYSQILGVPASLVGLLALISLCLGATLDLIIGPLSDCWRSPIGRRHPFMYATVVPFGISFFPHLLSRPIYGTFNVRRLARRFVTHSANLSLALSHTAYGARSRTVR
jgi:hypothetical protein